MKKKISRRILVILLLFAINLIPVVPSKADETVTYVFSFVTESGDGYEASITDIKGTALSIEPINQSKSEWIVTYNKGSEVGLQFQYTSGFGFGYYSDADNTHNLFDENGNQVLTGYVYAVGEHYNALLIVLGTANTDANINVYSSEEKAVAPIGDVGNVGPEETTNTTNNSVTQSQTSISSGNNFAPTNSTRVVSIHESNLEENIWYKVSLAINSLKEIINIIANALLAVGAISAIIVAIFQVNILSTMGSHPMQKRRTMVNLANCILCIALLGSVKVLTVIIIDLVI